MSKEKNPRELAKRAKKAGEEQSEGRKPGRAAKQNATARSVLVFCRRESCNANKRSCNLRPASPIDGVFSSDMRGTVDCPVLNRTIALSHGAITGQSFSPSWPYA